MRTLTAVLAVAVALSLPSHGRSQEGSFVASLEVAPDLSTQPTGPASETPEVPNLGVAPVPTPDMPGAGPGAPPQAAQPTDPSVPPGQWVYTDQYGWVWMPYADSYTYVPQDGDGQPYEYVYYPTYGWTWVVAPWIWGWGPWPYFGVYGCASFGWYGHGWWQYPSHWHYNPYYRPPFNVAAPYHGYPPRPAPGGQAGGPSRTAPAPHGASTYRAFSGPGAYPRPPTSFRGPVGRTGGYYPSAGTGFARAPSGSAFRASPGIGASHSLSGGFHGLGGFHGGFHH